MQYCKSRGGMGLNKIVFDALTTHSPGLHSIIPLSRILVCGISISCAKLITSHASSHGNMSRWQQVTKGFLTHSTYFTNSMVYLISLIKNGLRFFSFVTKLRYNLKRETTCLAIGQKVLNCFQITKLGSRTKIGNGK